MAVRVVAEGLKWSMSGVESVYANWGEIWSEQGAQADEEATCRMLGDRVVERFHEIAAENASSAAWYPQWGEVHAEEDEQGFSYDEWHMQALEEVGEQWTAGLIQPVLRKVNGQTRTW